VKAALASNPNVFRQVTVEVTVTDEPQVLAVIVSPDGAVIPAGHDVDFTATVVTAHNAPKTVTWSVSGVAGAAFSTSYSTDANETPVATLDGSTTTAA
jgi:hypothetical protein